AEDGIRDGHVTGVQTCALPIYMSLNLWTTPRPILDPRMRRLLVLGALALLLGLPATSQADRPQPPANQRPQEGCLVVTGGNGIRSEERRGGKGWRCRWGPAD